MTSTPSQLPAEATTFTGAGVLNGARRFFPLAVSVFAYGMVFGVLARQAGLSLRDSVLMSGFVAAGSSQFVALGMWQAPLPILSIVLTTLVVNLRHMLMGATMRPYLANLPARLIYPMLHLLGDEGWALTMQEFAAGRRDVGFFLGCGLLSTLAWLSSTAVGFVAASAIPDPAQYGLDFAFTAVFLGLLVGMWQGRSSIAPMVGAATVALMTAWTLGGKWYILLGGLAGSLAGLWGKDD